MVMRRGAAILKHTDFDLQLFANAPVGELATLGVGKESTFGTPVTPTIFHGIETFSATGKNTFIMRGASRKRPGMGYPTTGPVDFSLALRPESTPDTLGQLLAYAMGTQAAPSAALTQYVVNPSGSITGTGSAQAVTVSGSTTQFTNTSTAQISGGGNTEVVNVTAVTGSSLTINPVHNYTSAATITLLSPTAKQSLLTFGNLSVLPSFTTEYNRVTDAIDYFGCTIDQVKLALESAKGLTTDFTIVAAGEVKQASPATPTFSTKDIFAMEALGTSTLMNSVAIGTAANPPAVLKWDLTLNNQLDKTYRGAGSQRQVYGFPLGQRKISGTMTLGFESEAAQQLFWGGTTGPNAIVAGVPITFNVGCQDLADSTNNLEYSIQIILPNCAIMSAPVPNVTSGPLKQTVTFSAFETSATGNDLALLLVNLASAVY